MAIPSSVRKRRCRQAGTRPCGRGAAMLQRSGSPVRQAAKAPPAGPDPEEIMRLNTEKWLVN